MSLDLYIQAKKSIKKRGTGVYIRENGGTRELKSKVYHRTRLRKRAISTNRKQINPYHK